MCRCIDGCECVRQTINYLSSLCPLNYLSHKFSPTTTTKSECDKTGVFKSKTWAFKFATWKMIDIVSIRENKYKFKWKSIQFQTTLSHVLGTNGGILGIWECTHSLICIRHVWVWKRSGCGNQKWKLRMASIGIQMLTNMSDGFLRLLSYRNASCFVCCDKIFGSRKHILQAEPRLTLHFFTNGCRYHPNDEKCVSLKFDKCFLSF